MNWMSVLGLILVGLGTFISFLGTQKSDKNSEDNLISKINDKNKTIDRINDNNITLISQNSTLLSSTKDITESNKELINQNQEMLNKVGQYQNDILSKNLRIKELEDKISKVERGIESKTDFFGIIGIRQGGRTNTIYGDEATIYAKIIKLINEEKFLKLIKICDDNKAKYPEWYTLHFYKAIGLLNIDLEKNKNKALELLDYVINHTIGDIQYAIKLVYYLDQLNEVERINKVLDNISLNMIKSIDDETMRNMLLKHKK